MMHRESGKLALGTYIGPSPVAYLGTPDNVSQRIHMIVASGSETLLPRFSANRDPKVAQALFLNGTWAALAISIILFIPLIVLMPDFLRLWISPDFARESAAVGQLAALSYITQGAFAPPATFFRGSGKPWFVTIVIAFAGIATLLFSLLLIPAHGVLGVGYAYLLGSIAPFLGVVIGWFYMFGSSSIIPLIRSVGLPVLMGGIAFAAESFIRNWAADLSWVGLFAFGGFFAGLAGLLVLGVDWVLGGDSPSKALLKRIGESNKVNALLGYIHAKKVS
jgi:O-antigen/teichoic acid export membrane protein